MAVIDGDVRLTWAQFHDRVARYAAALEGLGVQPGDRVALLSGNSANCLASLFALFHLGAVAVPLNTRLAPPELAFQVGDCGARVLMVDAPLTRHVPALRDAGIALVIDIDPHQASEGCDHRGEALIATAMPAAERGITGERLAAIFYTGGTTGLPKGVMHSHASLGAMAINLVMQLQLDEQCVVLHSAPMFHLADFAIFVVTQVAGTHVIIPELSDAVMIDAIEAHGVTHSFTVPAVIDRIARSPGIAARNLSSLRVLGYGGAPMPWGTYLHARATFPDIDFVQGFGMTEMPAVTFLAAVHHREGADPARLQSAGQPGFGYEIRIVDTNGNTVERGQFGEIVGRGDNVMLGYWNRDDETRAALRGGWMHSGDAGFMDADGFVYITDRFKDMIVTGGENVYSIEVENVLSAHPAVLECAVIGVPDARWGERVHGVVTLKPGAAGSADELMAFCRGQLAGYKLPRSIDFHDGPLPRSGAGKVLKTVLREPYWQGTQRNV